MLFVTACIKIEHDICGSINTRAREENFITAFCFYKKVRFFIFVRSRSTIMKVICIGSADASNYKDLKLQISSKPSPHGKFYYFKDKIFLQLVKPTTSYAVWRNAGADGSVGNAKLIIDDDDVRKELRLLMDATAINNTGDNFWFGGYDHGKLFIKMGRNVPAVPTNHEILFCIGVSSVFVQNTNKTAYLQMEVTEISYRPIRLLGPFAWPKQQEQQQQQQQQQQQNAESTPNWERFGGNDSTDTAEW
jgi:hypothetical protein